MTDKPNTTMVDTSDLNERTGVIDSFRHRTKDSRLARSALDRLTEVRTEEQVKFGTAVIRTAGSVAIATTNARAVEKLASVQLVLESRVAGAIESVSAAEDQAIVSSGSICSGEIANYESLMGAGQVTAQDAKYATERAAQRHAFRLERAANRADRLAEGFDNAATEALRRSSEAGYESE